MVNLKPPQITDLLKEIKNCLDRGKYFQTKHAIQRQDERRIRLTDVVYVLKTGYHEKRKTTYDETFSTWKYAIRGKTLEDLNIRVIVAFDDKNLLIITAINLTDE